VLALTSPAHAQNASNTLPPAVQAALQQAGVPASSLFAVALPLGPQPRWWQRPVPAWQHQASAVVQPGSTMKLVTSVVALDRLGPNLRGSTELRTAAPLVDGQLMGDLVLKGGADPDLGVPQFWALLQTLRHQGVVHLRGNLVVDRHLWRPARLDVGLPPFDDAPEFPYNVIPDALHLAGSLLPLVITSGADGTVRAATVPPLLGLHISSNFTANSNRCNDWDDTWLPAQVSAGAGTEPDTRIVLQGSFPANCSQNADLQLIDRLELADRLFRTLWQQMGGLWTGRAVEATAPTSTTGTRLLARRTSRPLGEVLRQVNKTSDNALSRMLFLNLGVAGMASNPSATTAELAAQAMHAWFAEHGINSAGLVLDNGSGLSRSERITPLLLAQMLQVAHTSRYAADLAMSLPTAGVDGTMRNRLKNSVATGWARLKTGTLKNTVALAGYVNDPTGRPWAVALVINDDKAAGARPVLDALVDHIARHGPHGVAAASAPGPQAD
jgi:serine-type D-Ala-D-Ala carboxypeptidase/endopeptidase (penicillin-binding protein 4)